MDMDQSLPAEAFDKVDKSDDLSFYAPPRLVMHIDETAVAALQDFYRDTIPNGGDILDLMSSWVSHLPDDHAYRNVVGHGMNDEELTANPRLDRRFVADLNADPGLPLETGVFDAALCCVGVQYLQRPFDVFAEVRRTLRPGAPFIVSYSNRCFPTKAVAIWRSLDMREQAALIARYFEESGFVEVRTELLADGSHGDPLIVVVGIA